MPVAVVIPAFNEAATIADIVGRARRQVATVIVVDDGSWDDTAHQAQSAGAQVLCQPMNQGKGAALWRGMQEALLSGVDAVMTLDGDGQHCPEDLPKLLEMHQVQPKRLIIAARLAHRDRAPPLRRFANGMADFWISWAAGCPICDTQSGFRLYPAALLRKLPPPGNQRGGFVFESEVLIRAAHHGHYPATVGIATLYHAQGRPSHYQPWRDTLRIIAMVGWKLIKRGLYPLGLLRSLGYVKLKT
ncbi:MAG: glycosyltransferase family 2 protein [Candidatus Competibacteraceae bacterium]|nr:glycosyltransferase family 2 protein [Candidatus Competibacteraceae bacterium]